MTVTADARRYRDRHCDWHGGSESDSDPALRVGARAWAAGCPTPLPEPSDGQEGGPAAAIMGPVSIVSEAGLSPVASASHAASLSLGAAGPPPGRRRSSCVAAAVPGPRLPVPQAW